VKPGIVGATDLVAGLCDHMPQRILEYPAVMAAAMKQQVDVVAHCETQRAGVGRGQLCVRDHECTALDRPSGHIGDGRVHLDVGGRCASGSEVGSTTIVTALQTPSLRSDPRARRARVSAHAAKRRRLERVGHSILGQVGLLRSTTPAVSCCSTWSPPGSVTASPS
jgi:hypothetical protein